MKQGKKQDYSGENKYKKSKKKIKGIQKTPKYPYYLIKVKDSDLIPSQLVYLKHMRFANDNSIDCRMKGRPFLVFDVTDEFAYLLKISSSKPDFECKYPIYHEVILTKKRNTHNKPSYVDLRYVYVVDRKTLEQKVISEAEPVLGKYISYKVEIIDEKDYLQIKNKIDYLKRMIILKASVQNLEEFVNNPQKIRTGK